MRTIIRVEEEKMTYKKMFRRIYSVTSETKSEDSRVLKKFGIKDKKQLIQEHQAIGLFFVNMCINQSLLSNDDKQFFMDSFLQHNNKKFKNFEAIKERVNAYGQILTNARSPKDLEINFGIEYSKGLNQKNDAALVLLGTSRINLLIAHQEKPILDLINSLSGHIS